MNELEQYRREIDRIDGELVKLFLEPMAVTCLLYTSDAADEL